MFLYLSLKKIKVSLIYLSARENNILAESLSLEKEKLSNTNSVTCNIIITKTKEKSCSEND